MTQGTTFKNDDLRLLHKMGFYCIEEPKNCTWEQDGPIESPSCLNYDMISYFYDNLEWRRFLNLKERPKVPYICQDDYRTAFGNLAGLGSFDIFGSKIDPEDVAALKDPVKLAKLIENDPVYTGTIKPYQEALEFGKKEIGNEILRTDYRRMMVYLQLALNKILGDGTLNVDGNYGQAMKSAVTAFWMGIDINDYLQDGRLIGINTMNAILKRLKFSKKEILERLNTSMEILKDAGSENFGMTLYSDLDERGHFVQNAIYDALKCMGIIDYVSDPSDMAVRKMVWQKIQDNFKENPADEKGPDRFGPIVLSRIVKAAENAPFALFRE